VVDQRDVDLVIAQIFATATASRNPRADVNSDGAITAADVVAVVRHVH